MKTDFFKEVHKLGHDDEWRYHLLIRGLRKIQEEKQNQGFFKRLERRLVRKYKKIEISAWK
ncbi:hypothetical protein BK133_06670 [Paenibacillus sp. FSL H8-0548]|uniref:hypothetical protein n=1 Tax=Paenibacillus sp. FSL H8-0548 TaxID=1920422 RepID=UPI00096E84A3|nr:hypothetical protein [Paenibacillus sp. FSL H8-0548]OMF37279.1 hypothetical protein BK133_06670 [Paenibacillus sp. FSL H8-0548]